MRFPQMIWGVLIGLFLIPLTGFSQKGLLDKANKQYELHNFKQAITTYQRYIKGDRNNVEAKGKLADCFRHLGRQKEALRWYTEIGNVSKQFPKFLLGHAQLLQEMGEYKLARKLFLDYAEEYPEDGMHFAEANTIALEKLKAPPTYKVTPEYISSDAADFGPAFYGDGILYSSARIDYSEKDKQRDDLNQLFISNIDFNENLGNPQVFHQRFKGYNEGPIAYSPDRRWVAITKNNFVDGIRQIPSSGLNLNIFIGEVLANGEWQNEKFFLYNGSSFSTGYPSFSPDGNALYFASDRPNGFGGFDIYVSYRNGNEWGPPENLGPTVNTKGNEISPFFDGLDLYFSSDWHEGMGGLDVFRATKNGTYWDRVFNLDTQINSSNDDYGFIYDNVRNLGYLVSNRAGGKGKEDIYKVTKSIGGKTNQGSYPGGNTQGPYTGGNTQNPYPGGNTQGAYPGNQNGGTYPTSARTLAIVVLDEYTMQPIPNAEIDMAPCGLSRFYSDNNGRANLNIPAGLNCEIYVRQNGYITGLMRISGTSLTGVQNQQILLRNGTSSTTPPVVNTPTNTPSTRPTTNLPNNLIMGRLYDAADNSGVEGVAITAVNQATGRTLETSTAITGEYNLSLQTNATYIITYSKAGYGAINRTVIVGNTLESNLLGAYPIKYTGAVATTSPSSRPDVSKGTTGTGEMAGYSVQVAAFSTSDKTDFNKFKDLGTYGNVYNRYENSRTKVRVGVFSTKAEAAAAARRIKSQGYRDAFVTSELRTGLGEGIVLNTNNMGTAVATNNPSSGSSTTGNTSGGVYKVRLASYRNPRFFNEAKVEGLGIVERQVKKPWTIMLLTGYATLSDAIFAKNNALKAGFRQAHVVIDNGSELKKVKF